MTAVAAAAAPPPPPQILPPWGVAVHLEREVAAREEDAAPAGCSGLVQEDVALRQAAV